MTAPERRRMRDDQLIEWIKSFVDRHQYAPSIREIGKKFGHSSSATTKAWVDRLRKEKRLDWIDGETRTLHVVELSRSMFAFDLAMNDELGDCDKCGNVDCVLVGELTIITNRMVSAPVEAESCIICEPVPELPEDEEEVIPPEDDLDDGQHL